MLVGAVVAVQTMLNCCRSGASHDELGEEDPIGWFEMEEEWDEVEVKMQQCRISKVNMYFS